MFLATSHPRRFRKSIITHGDYIHPVTLQEFVLTPADVALLGSETKRFIDNGNQCGFPDGHSDSALDNLGWWPGEFWVENEWLWGVVEASTDDVAERLRNGAIKFVSPRIAEDWIDAKRNRYRNVMRHICATPVPVIPGQGGFEVDLSAAIVLPTGLAIKKKEVKMQKIAAALGLDLSVSEDRIVEVLNAKLAAAEEKRRSLQTELDTLRKASADEFIDRISKEAAAIGVPIPREKLDKVRRLFEANLAADAKELGEAFLDVARAISMRPADAKPVPEPVDGRDTSVEQNRLFAEMMRRNGVEVLLSSDGRTVLSTKAIEQYQPA